MAKNRHEYYRLHSSSSLQITVISKYKDQYKSKGIMATNNKNEKLPLNKPEGPGGEGVRI
jgi:hypothetical protein